MNILFLTDEFFFISFAVITTLWERNTRLELIFIYFHTDELFQVERNMGKALCQEKQSQNTSEKGLAESKKDRSKCLVWSLFPLNLVTLERLLEGVPIMLVFLKYGHVLQEVDSGYQYLIS